MEIFRQLLRREPAHATFDLFDEGIRSEAGVSDVKTARVRPVNTMPLRASNSAAVKSAARGFGVLGMLFVAASAAVWGKAIVVRRASVTVTLPPAQVAPSKEAVGASVSIAATKVRAQKTDRSSRPAEQALQPASQAAEAIVMPADTSASRRSRYTSLEPRSCTIFQENAAKADQRLRRCAGIDGYALETSPAGEVRHLIILKPDGQRANLDLSPIAAKGSLGKLAEWRAHYNGDLRAVILRFSAPGKVSSLIVAKLTPTPCIVAVIPRGAGQNEKARGVADRKHLECLAG